MIIKFFKKTSFTFLFIVLFNIAKLINSNKNLEKCFIFFQQEISKLQTVSQQLKTENTNLKNFICQLLKEYDKQLLYKILKENKNYNNILIECFKD